MIRLRVVAIAFLLVSGAASAQDAGTLDREAALVQFFGGGSPLLPQERAELDDAVRQAFRSDPQGAQAAAVESSKMLALTQSWRGERIAMGRELGRRAIAFSGMQALGRDAEGATAARIVAAHDPVVVADPASQVLVTMQTVRALVEGNRTGAQLFAVPAPGPDAVAELAARIQREWHGVDAGLRQALSNAGRDMPYAAQYLGRSPQAARARFIADYRAKIMAAPDPAGRQFNLAEVMAFTAMTGYKNQSSGGGGGGVLGMMAGIQNRQAMMDRAGRSLMPSCGVPAGSVMSPERRSFCQPSLIP